MTPTIQPLSESFEPTQISDRRATVEAAAPLTTTYGAKVLAFKQPEDAEAPIPPGFRSIEDVVADFERDPQWREELKLARSWVADTVLAQEPLTLRKIRLQKGMSQTQLAEAIGTQQPHIARIESGNADLRLDTCRRLAVALGIDLNTLDQALQRQGAA